MEKIRYLIGVTGGLVGVNLLMRCSGSCPSCFGCAGFGMGMALFAFIKRK